MGKFSKGLFFGGLAGAGLMWLGVTKKGKEVKEKILDHAADVYGDIKDVLMKSDAWKKMNKNQYVKMVKEKVDKYAIENGLAENVKNMIVKVVSSQWNNIQKEIKKRG